MSKLYALNISLDQINENRESLLAIAHIFNTKRFETLISMLLEMEEQWEEKDPGEELSL